MQAVQVIDGFLPVSRVREVIAAWPGPDWPHWHRYDTVLERKRTCRDWPVIPEPLRRLLAEMSLCCPGTNGLVPDLSLYGSGLCDMRQGDFLSLHLDHDVHPLLGLTRRKNAILFLADQATQDGPLCLWDGDRTAPTTVVCPAPGRLCLFDATETSYHNVRPVRGESPRRTLSVYFYGWPRVPFEKARRPRARFVGAASEAADPELDHLRTERSSLPKTSR